MRNIVRLPFFLFCAGCYTSVLDFSSILSTSGGDADFEKQTDTDITGTDSSSTDTSAPSDSFSVDDNPPPPSHEPPGFTVRTDFDFSTIAGDCWSGTGSSFSRITNDSLAPKSPQAVLEYEKPPNSTGGDTHFCIVTNSSKLYVALWFKISDPYYGLLDYHDSLLYLRTTDAPYLNFVLRGPPFGTYEILPQINALGANNTHLAPSGGGADLDPNRSGATVSPGVWHKLEVRIENSLTPTSQNGILHWWVDGVLAGEFNTVNYANFLWREVYFSPGWIPEPLQTLTDYIRYDHIYVSGQ